MTDIAQKGEIIAGRYRIEGVLGRGGMGAVFDATQIGLERKVAIKLMHPEVGVDDEFRARFGREARVTSAIQHPGVVKVFDFGEDGGRLFIVMERLEGHPLRAILDDKQLLPLPRALDIAMQITEVLIAAHALPLVHRDLKPENIFLEQRTDGSDRVVIVDFGLAFIDQREGVERMTKAGALMGTPSYISPEQIRGPDVGPPADIYSFGCMLYELVTGDTPFDGAPMMLLPKHLFEAPMPPSRRRADNYIPRALEGLILGMLAKRPDDRPTASAAYQLLAQLSTTLGERERARGREALDGRAARMIPTIRSALDQPELDHPTFAEGRPKSWLPPGASVIAVIGGELPSELALGLRANGYYAQPAVESWPEGMRAIYAPGASAELLTALVATGFPVLTDVDAASLDAVSASMAIGVADVVTRPVKVDQLAKKIGRALRKHQRRREA